MRKTAIRAFFALSVATAALAADRVDPVYKARGGAALSGYDAVAYFDQAKPVKGSRHFPYSWNGATWHFSSDENRRRFASEPERYAPQFGGYCAYAVGHGYTAPGDPNAWKIVDGRLYLNYNRDVLKKWEADQVNLIPKGRQNWSRLTGSEDPGK